MSRSVAELTLPSYLACHSELFATKREWRPAFPRPNIELCHSPRAIRRSANVNIRLATSALLVPSNNGPLEFFCFFRRNEVDGAPSEATAGHARAVHCGNVLRQLDQQIDFSTCNFVIIAHAEVRLSHKASER